MGRWAAVLVQTHRAESVDGQTNLLAKAHKQPVDLAPQVPATEEHLLVTFKRYCTSRRICTKLNYVTAL